MQADKNNPRIWIRNCLAAGILAVGFFSSVSDAKAYSDIDLPWSTSFGNTPIEIIRYEGIGYSCDNCIDGLGVVEDHEYNAHIDATANHPGGSGAMGSRCEVSDGANQFQSHAIGTSFATPQPELWFRFYLKYETDFTWSTLHYHKWVYFGDSAAINSAIMGFMNGEMYVGTILGDFRYAGAMWGTYWGGGQPGSMVSDGSWHAVEFHIKMDSTSFPANGEADLWIDGAQMLHETDVDYSEGSTTRRLGWTFFRFNTNQSSPGNAGGIGSPASIYYDDVAISNTGYIGPMIGSDIIPPVNPSGLSVS